MSARMLDALPCSTVKLPAGFPAARGLSRLRLPRTTRACAARSEGTGSEDKQAAGSSAGPQKGGDTKGEQGLPPPMSLFPWQPQPHSLVPLSAMQPSSSPGMGVNLEWDAQSPSSQVPGSASALPLAGNVLSSGPAESNEETPALQPLWAMSESQAQGIILRAAMGTGWTTQTGLEGPSLEPGFPSPAGAGLGSAGAMLPFGEADGAEEATEAAAQAPRNWPELSKSPRRTARVKFTCNRCGERTMRAINPHAYGEGTVFVQCGGCLVFHKLVDNLNLFHELKGHIFQGADAGNRGFGVHESVDVLGAEDHDLPPLPFL